MHKRNKVLGIIPARYGSSRFPGKPLAMIAGKSMIERVYYQARKASGLDDVVVATDDVRIEKAVRESGGKVVMTSPSHASGTDRCVEAVEKTGGTWDVVINIQGDEPMINPEQINQVVACFDDAVTEIATLVKLISDETERMNPNVVKAVVSSYNKALYFSRSPLPFLRDKNKDAEATAFYKHIGIYGYRTATLKKIAMLPVSMLEKSEALEQLRWLENGYQITTAVTAFENIAIDSPDDVKTILNFMSLHPEYQ